MHMIPTAFYIVILYEFAQWYDGYNVNMIELAYDITIDLQYYLIVADRDKQLLQIKAPLPENLSQRPVAGKSTAKKRLFI